VWTAAAIFVWRVCAELVVFVLSRILASCWGRLTLSVAGYLASLTSCG
jgi:hypothetical protein